jgi:hypothetical protein
MERLHEELNHLRKQLTSLGFSRPGGKARFATNMEQRLLSLTQRFGFKPTKVEVNTRFGVATIYFNNQKGEATRLVSKLAPAMAQMGIPASAIKAREVHYPADPDLGDDKPMDLSIVTIDFNVLDKHNPKGFSRPGEAEAFSIGSDSTESDPTRDERLIELANKVGKEHTVNLFARWAEGKATNSRVGSKAHFEKSDDYERILMQPVTDANVKQMMKVVTEAQKYAKSVGDNNLFELAEEVGHECLAHKSRA